MMELEAKKTTRSYDAKWKAQKLEVIDIGKTKGPSIACLYN
jgi:hypothetical protein